MAKTIADTPIRPARAAYRPIGAPEPSEAAEAETEDVSADPKIRRSSVLYVEAREGIDGPAYFNACASCSSFIPEALMRGAVRGDRCAKFDSSMPVTDDSSCNLWTPWPNGVPSVDCQHNAAEAVIKGQRGAVSIWDAGYFRDKKRRCETCKQFDAGDSSCELMEAMSAKLPAVFDMDPAVKRVAKCNLWTDPAPPEAML